jgi:hypothetical protein
MKVRYRVLYGSYKISATLRCTVSCDATKIVLFSFI